ncbi:hypothetical protein [Methylobacillus flagellatus]|uniref:hypothetical protein n=1 Tax=Methylobacillus flagellatus TaxID=405 RepID=UPI0010F61469|nr:hypothetical protein [Methylobacillus flagellatus]
MSTLERATTEITRIDWDFSTIPGWNATQQMWDEWDDIAAEEFEVSSNYSPIPAVIYHIEDYQ